MRYLPHTQDEIAEMLQAVGARDLDELFASIPADVRSREPLDVPPPLDEPALMSHLQQLAERNRGAALPCFVGAGAYEHHFPPAADQLLLRSELYTAYTPYQPEVAQGTLQIIFEFQTIVSEVLGLPVANASMYDGATAATEAVLMARRLTRRDRMVLSECVHPHYLATLETYTRELDGDAQGESNAWVQVPVGKDSATDIRALSDAIDDQTACVVVGYPGFYGSVADLRPLAEAAHAKGALLVTATWEPFALALVEPPGAQGADIAAAEGQPMGLPPQYGGPGVGLFASRDARKFLQQMPGRLAGQTIDQDEQTGYVLTLATREQHIRRERATSNICTNSGLCATAMTIKMCLLGKQGFIQVAEQCLAKAEYLKQGLGGLAGYEIVSQEPTFNEFTLAVPGADAAHFVTTLAEQGLVAGLELGQVSPARAGHVLVAVTEKHSRAELDRFVALAEAYRSP